MSSLPNSKSSLLHATRSCSALALAGAIVLPMTPVLAQDAVPAANTPVVNAATPQPVTQNAAKPTYSTDYGGTLYTHEGGTVKVKGSGFTKEWREQHGTVVFYIAAEENHVYGVEPIKDLLRLEEGKDFTIADDGTFEATMTIEAHALTTYYNTLESHQLTELTNVRYETGILAEPKGQPASTIEDIWARKNVIDHHPMYTSDYPRTPETFESFAPKLKYNPLKDTTQDQDLVIKGDGFNGPTVPSRYGMFYVIREKGAFTPVLLMSSIMRYGTDDEYYFDIFPSNPLEMIKIPANTLDPSKQYVIEVWGDNGYQHRGTHTFITPVVGLAPEYLGTLHARQDLKFEGVPEYADAFVPENKPRAEFKSKLGFYEQRQHATRGELASLLYAQAGSPKVDLPEASPWPDVKTDDLNYAAYIWARQKGITFGWSDGKFHADASISNATVAAFTYRAAGSPAVPGVSPFTNIKPNSAFYREILWSAQQYLFTTHYGTFDAAHMVTRGELEEAMFNLQNPVQWNHAR